MRFEDECFISYLEMRYGVFLIHIGILIPVPFDTSSLNLHERWEAVGVCGSTLAF